MLIGQMTMDADRYLGRHHRRREGGMIPIAVARGLAPDGGSSAAQVRNVEVRRRGRAILEGDEGRRGRATDVPGQRGGPARGGLGRERGGSPRHHQRRVAAAAVGEPSGQPAPPSSSPPPGLRGGGEEGRTIVRIFDPHLAFPCIFYARNEQRMKTNA
jgi:hypothetical protein